MLPRVKDNNPLGTQGDRFTGRLVKAARETSKFQNWSLLTNSRRRYMAEILLIRRKTLYPFNLLNINLFVTLDQLKESSRPTPNVSWKEVELSWQKTKKGRLPRKRKLLIMCATQGLGQELPWRCTKMRQGVWGSLEAPSGSQTGPSRGLERSPQGTHRF